MTYEKSLKDRVRFIYDGQLDPKKMQKQGFGRYYDFHNSKVAVGYFEKDVPFGKMILYLQDDSC